MSASRGDAENPKAPERQGLYTGVSFRDDLLADIEAASRELVICSPMLHKSRFFSMAKACSAAQQRGVRVLVITQPTSEYAPSKQEEAGRLVSALETSALGHVELPQPLHRFITIDGRIAWYGSANAMGYWGNDDCMVRLEDAAVATALQDSVRPFL